MSDGMSIVRPESSRAYLNKSNNLHVRQHLDSNGKYRYKVSTTKNCWSYVKKIFRIIFCCSATLTKHGLAARKIIEKNHALKKRVNHVSISKLASENELEKQMEEELPKTYCVKNKALPVTELLKGEGGGELAEKFAVHSLKNAATRIFHDPLRFFLELIVNSFDASLPPEKRIGKFGLGFISILNFLDHPETEGNTVSIETTSKSDKGLYSTLTMDLFKIQESYQVIFKDAPRQKETGTTITLKPKKGKFSKQTLESLFQYCSALQFYEHGKIEVIYEGKTFSIGDGSKTLAWVTLDQDKLVVQDKGCGISEEVAAKKLFVPSISTKSPQNERDFALHLPAFKVYSGKRDNRTHFLITVNGVLVIDIPFNSPADKDLVLKMPPSTRLTLARDAIENRPETVQHLKKVIDETVKASVDSKEGALILLALSEGLKTWEAMVPSIAETHLRSYLQLSVQKFFQENAFIPYPLHHEEALSPILPKNTKLIPYPKELLFDHFEAFEKLLEEHYSAEKKDNLIAGKSVLFTDSDKVTALGLKQWIFAPKTLLDSKPSKKSLQMALITRFADDGKALDCPRKKSSLPGSMASTKGFLFITGRSTLPRLLTKTDWSNVFFFFSDKKYKHKKLTYLPKRSQEITKACIELIQLGQIFENRDDKPFAEMWEKHSKCLIEHFSSIDSICMDKSKFCKEFKYSKKQMKTFIWFEENTSKEMECFSIKDSEAVFRERDKICEALPKMYYSCEKEEALLKKLGTSIYNLSERLSPAQGCKLLFAWLFAQLGVLNNGIRIFTDEKVIWPPEEITVAYLEHCFEIFFKNRIHPSKIIISPIQPNQGIWKILDDFTTYKPYGPLAIKHILPLLQLREKMAQEKLPEHLKKKFDLCIQQLLALYRNFLEIKIGEVDKAYGSKLSIVSVVDTTDFDACTVNEIVTFLTSLKDKPALFEKCLDFYVQEMGERMNTQKRNKKLSENKALYIENVCFNNVIALLSIAKSIGVDSILLETILQHVNNPFELYVMGLLLIREPTYLLSEWADDERNEMKKIDNKQEIQIRVLILTEAITIYLRKSNPQKFIKQYNEKYPNFKRLSHIYEKEFGSLLSPIFTYFWIATSSIKRSEDGAFTIDTQAIPSAIVEKLQLADSFTSMQVIHAAQNGSNFAEALQKGAIGQAALIARQQPSESDLKVITQAVEHGSERSSITSILIEAFQNSLDAIRNFLKKNPNAPAEIASVFFDVRMVGKEEPKLLLEISDRIGMTSLKTLLADFLIPNYSEKGEESVGEMGNGSYQMYRDAELVTVKTRTLENPSRVYFLRIEPIRHFETQEVIDLRHTCVDITDLEPDFAGTTLSVLMRGNHQSKTAAAFEGFLARNFIKETFALANPPLGEKHPLTCTLQLRKEKLLLNGIDRNNSFTITGSNFCCYKIDHGHDLGYVLTDGYPFKLLETFLIEEELFPPNLAVELAHGWCLNLPKGSYSPVQSRTRVHMNEKTKEELKVFLLDWIYYRSCSNEGNGLQTRYYPHFASRSSEFYQVYPAVRKSAHSNADLFKKGDPISLETFFVCYKPSFLQRSFLEYIDDGYEKLVKPLLEIRKSLLISLKRELTPQNRRELYDKLITSFRTAGKEIEEKWRKDLQPHHPYEKNFLDNVLIPWFTNKTATFYDNIPSLNSLAITNQEILTVVEVEQQQVRHESMGINREQINELLKTSTQILTSYCNKYAEKNGMDTPPKIGFIYLNEPTKAFYRVAEHKIYINLAQITLSSILEMGKQVASEIPLQDDPLVSVSYMSSGTLNHELEHARRHKECGKDAHARMAIDGKDFDFEACASYFAKKAQIAGLFEEWAKDLEQHPFPEAELIAKLIEVEKTCPEMLLQAK